MSVKIIRKLVENINTGVLFLDQDVHNNESIFRALVDSGLKRSYYDGASSTELLALISAIEKVVKNMGQVLEKERPEGVGRLNCHVLMDILIKLLKHEIARDVEQLMIVVICSVNENCCRPQIRKKLREHLIQAMGAEEDLAVMLRMYGVISDVRVNKYVINSGKLQLKMDSTARRIWYLMLDQYTKKLDFMVRYVTNYILEVGKAVMVNKVTIGLEFMEEVIAEDTQRIPVKHRAVMKQAYEKCNVLGIQAQNPWSGDVGAEIPSVRNQYDQLIESIGSLDFYFSSAAVHFDLKKEIASALDTDSLLPEDTSRTDWAVLVCEKLELILKSQLAGIGENMLCMYKYIENVGKLSCIIYEYCQDSDLCKAICSGEPCSICFHADNVKYLKQKRKVVKPECLKVLANLLVGLLGNPFVVSHNMLVLEILISFRRLFLKIDINEFPEAVFKFISACLNSSVRNVRVLAGKLIPLYVLNDREANKLEMIKYLNGGLRGLSVGAEKYLVENKIMIWGELVVVLEGEILNVVIMKLLDYFNDSNSFYSSIAYTTFINIVEIKDLTAWQLIYPFLPNLSLTITKQIVSKSIFSQMISELLNVSTNDILYRTIPYTVPYLLTYYSKDIIKEISTTANLTKYQLLKQQMPKILAILFTSLEYLDYEDKTNSYVINQQKIMDILVICDPYFKTKTLKDLVNPVADIWEISKMYDATNYNRIKGAIIYVIKLQSSAGVEKFALNFTKSDQALLEEFFKRSLLGIIQLFSDLVKNKKGKSTYVEKLKSLVAVEFLVQISGIEIIAGLPQIWISLQKLLAEDELLHYQSLKCIRILINNINLNICFDLVISIILQTWVNFDDNSKQMAKEILIQLFNTNTNDTFKNYYFSIMHNKELVDVYKSVKIRPHDQVNETRLIRLEDRLEENALENLDPLAQNTPTLLRDIFRRLKVNNKYVILQALCDLQLLMKNSGGGMYQFQPELKLLMRQLLSNCVKFKLDSYLICQSAKCIGLIGGMQEYGENEEKTVEEVFPLTETDLLSFNLGLLNLLVEQFWGSEDPGKQVFLAYGMQEILKSINIKSQEDLKDIPTFDETTVETLTPFLYSQYELNSSSVTSCHYPVFKYNKNHNEWVRELTLDLLHQLQQHGPSGTLIKFFDIYVSIIKGQDISIALKLFPYLILVVIMEDFQEYASGILNEFLRVLECDSDSSQFNYEVTKNIKLFYRTVFLVLDYLNQYVANKSQHKSKKLSSNRRLIKETQGIQLVKGFLSKIPQRLVARRSFQCKSYERAVLNLETIKRSDKEAQAKKAVLGELVIEVDIVLLSEESDTPMTDHQIFSGNSLLTYEQLRVMYDKLHDYDSVIGSLRESSTFELQELSDISTANIRSSVLELQYEDNWNIALNNFELINDKVDYLKYLNKKNLNDQVLLKLNSIEMSSNLPIDLLNIGLESTLLEADFANMNKYVAITDSLPSINDAEVLINLYITKIFCSLKQRSTTDVNLLIDRSYDLIGSLLSLNGFDKLLINKLHILQDLKNPKNHQLFFERLKSLGSDFESNWYILTVRKSLKDLNFGNSEFFAELLLERSKLETKHGRLDLASKSAIESYIAKKSNVSEFQYAKILWEQGEEKKAIKIVDHIIHNNPSKENGAAYQLSYSNWLEKSNSGLTNDILESYQQSIDLNPQWCESYYCLAKYHYKINPTENLNDIIRLYLRCLNESVKYLRELLPKIITLWVDYGNSVNYENEPVLADIETNVSKSVEMELPLKYWFSVFSQLLSRLPKTKNRTYKVIFEKCLQCIEHYPEQSLWAVFAQFNSDDDKRSLVGKKLIRNFMKSPNCVAEKWDSNKNLFNKANEVFLSFKRMTKIEKSRNTKVCSLKSDFKFDHKIVPAPLVVPNKRNFTINASRDLVTIVKFVDKVHIMNSLQRPRRLEMVGTDGKIYSVLFKLNDDLRKDSKLMELTNMIDDLLHQDYQSHKRNLHINTFAVIPLNESYGIIEWVSNHRTIKSILDEKYHGKESLLHIRKQYENKKLIPDKVNYYNYLRNYYQPVLYQWFIDYFPDPTAWYGNRNSFVRTLAVMSMVGYILGIGDRHGENILISQTNGDVLHVDFDCLFDKGAILRIPERVPFRLTPNIVDACGIGGVEGTFRLSSEVTMSLLRNNEDTLMNILEAFIHDPIMEWKGSRLGTPESTLSKIRSKLRGILEKESLPISIAGQVNYLIQEATSPENLAQMYFGWLPFW